MSSNVVPVPNGETISQHDQKKQKAKVSFIDIFSSLKERTSKLDMRKVIHSVKVGLALVLVSLLYLLDPLFQKVGQNAMWAIMTVVVVFEFYAGATLSKGINRAIGTVLGGGLGCVAAILADKSGEIGGALVVGFSVIVIGAGATYSRLIPSVKKRYDYGVMIFILTFNLVVVSGVRADKIMKLAGERLSTIGMGFAVCIFTSFIYPIWASDELHSSTASKFDKVASSIQGCLEEYFKIADDKEKQPTIDVSGCKSVLHSKSSDESLSNFAKWEPWHGKFGFFYPWEKYLQIGEVLRELAASVLSLKGCIQSVRQPSPTQRESIKEPCEIIGLSIAWILKEVGESIRDMKICRAKVLISPRTQCMIQELSLLVKTAENSTENLGLASFIFHLLEMVEKVEMVATKVEELGEIARFHTKKVDV
ncbi:aluminum-activated malate transporter 13-like [Nicotiana tabacum]|uniref:Aluminum-activated malate transporter 13-like n=1 Tax=Nicotiana tabacum TaxID=4097 RepID=A0A1S4CGX5_TOBAC|nr:PREDICTED: aluminum-activated malate transporter 13-like [Nicotiana tabacum]